MDLTNDIFDYSQLYLIIIYKIYVNYSHTILVTIFFAKIVIICEKTGENFCEPAITKPFRRAEHAYLIQLYLFTQCKARKESLLSGYTSDYNRL